MKDTTDFAISLPSSAFGLSNEEKSAGYSIEETPDDVNLMLIFCLYLRFILI